MSDSVRYERMHQPNEGAEAKYWQEMERKMQADTQRQKRKRRRRVTPRTGWTMSRRNAGSRKRNMCVTAAKIASLTRSHSLAISCLFYNTV